MLQLMELLRYSVGSQGQGELAARRGRGNRRDAWLTLAHSDPGAALPRQDNARGLARGHGGGMLGIRERAGSGASGQEGVVRRRGERGKLGAYGEGEREGGRSGGEARGRSRNGGGESGGGGDGEK